MAVAFIQEFPIVDRSTENYDAVASRLEGIEADGLIAHTAGFDAAAGVFRIFDIWESEEQGHTFLEASVTPLVNELFADRPEAGPPSREGFYELHHVLTTADVRARSRSAAGSSGRDSADPVEG